MSTLYPKYTHERKLFYTKGYFANVKQQLYKDKKSKVNKDGMKKKPQDEIAKNPINAYVQMNKGTWKLRKWDGKWNVANQPTYLMNEWIS